MPDILSPSCTFWNDLIDNSYIILDQFLLAHSVVVGQWCQMLLTDQ